MFTQSSIELDGCCEDEKIATSMRLFLFIIVLQLIFINRF